MLISTIFFHSLIKLLYFPTTNLFNSRLFLFYNLTFPFLPLLMFFFWRQIILDQLSINNDAIFITTEGLILEEKNDKVSFD